MFNIITITKEDEEGFQKTSDSLKKQTLQDFFWIIKCGNEKSNYVDQISSWCKNKIIIKSKDNGIYNAFNIALEYKNKDWTNFLNGGDILNNQNVLENLLKILKSKKLKDTNKKIIICGGTRYFFLSKRNFVKKPKTLNQCSGIFSYRIPTVHQSMFFSKAIIEEQNFDESFKICGDGDYFWRAIKKGAIVININLILSSFQFGGISSRVNNFVKQREVYRFIKKNKSINKFKIIIASFLSLITTFIFRIFILFDRLSES